MGPGKICGISSRQLPIFCSGCEVEEHSNDTFCPLEINWRKYQLYKECSDKQLGLSTTTFQLVTHKYFVNVGKFKTLQASERSM